MAIHTELLGSARFADQNGNVTNDLGTSRPRGKGGFKSSDGNFTTHYRNVIGGDPELLTELQYQSAETPANTKPSYHSSPLRQSHDTFFIRPHDAIDFTKQLEPAIDFHSKETPETETEPNIVEIQSRLTRRVLKGQMHIKDMASQLRISVRDAKVAVLLYELTETSETHKTRVIHDRMKPLPEHLEGIIDEAVETVQQEVDPKALEQAYAYPEKMETFEPNGEWSKSSKDIQMVFQLHHTAPEDPEGEKTTYALVTMGEDNIPEVTINDVPTVHASA